VKVDKPSFLVRPGDVITVRKRANLKELYGRLVEEVNSEPVSWLSLDLDKMEAVVRGYPTPADISLPVEIALVVEFMSR
jgi:small subunit ribosomal protein S4